MSSGFIGQAEWFSSYRRTIQMDGIENCIASCPTSTDEQGEPDLFFYEHKDAMFVNFQVALKKQTIFQRKYGLIRVRLLAAGATSGTNRPCKKEAIR